MQQDDSRRILSSVSEIVCCADSGGVPLGEDRRADGFHRDSGRHGDGQPSPPSHGQRLPVSAAAKRFVSVPRRLQQATAGMQSDQFVISDQGTVL